MRHDVRLLVIATKFDVEDHHRDILAVGREIKRHFKPAMHSKRTVAFVIETDETSAELVDRLRPVLSNERFHNFWCHSPGADIIGKDGSMDPLTIRVREAYDRVRKWNQTEYLRKPKRPQPVVERPVNDLVGSTPIKVSYRPRRKRKPPRKPNRPEYL